MEPYGNNAPMNPLSEAPLYKVTFQVTEKDYITSRKNAIEKDYSARRFNMTQVILITLIYVLIAVFIVRFLTISEDKMLDFASKIVYIVSITVLMVGYWALKSFFQKRKVKKAARTSALESGEVNTPIQLSLYRDRLQLSSHLSGSDYLYADISVNEKADGLTIFLYKDVIAYVSARFFDQNTAFQITSFLQQALGGSYRREAYMQVGETAQSVQAVPEDEAPLYEFNFLTEQKDTRPIVMRDALEGVLALVLGGVGATLLAYILGKYLSRWFYIAMILCGSLFVITVIGVGYGFLSCVFSKEIPEAIYQKYFRDRMKITVGSTETTITYDKIKKVGFFKDSVVIDLKDGKWQYIPKSQFFSEQKAEEFVQFLQKQISENKHQSNIQKTGD